MDRQGARNITESDLERMLLDEAIEPRALPFSLLEKITDSFSYKREIGKGGFAGRLENGVVAVKRLANTYMYENEFLREIECLMKVKHKNVVRFLGYCSDTQGNIERYNGKVVMADIQERLLCFEYVPNGSLDRYIKGASGGLEWTKIYQIIKGICEGLHFLHNINILHLDLKPSNILMDDNLIPKITDFGLSRSFEELQTRVIATKMFETLGYLAPEFTSSVITHKFDLYSLGVIILEMLTSEKECCAIENILESWGKRLELSQGDPRWEQIRVCAEIGIECTDIDPAKRPISMKHVRDRIAKMKSTEPVNLIYTENLFSLDTHPTEPWIVAGHSSGHVSIWNHESERTMDSFKISEKSVYSVKFHATRKWIVAVTRDEFIHVYDCAYVTKIQKITSFRPHTKCIGYSVGIHPTKPYVMSASMELWDGDKDWKCTREYLIPVMRQLAFNPDDPNIFASVSYYDFVQVWSLVSTIPSYTLDGHSDTVKCLHFFKHGYRHYLITGSDDCTAKIWDLQEKVCIHTIEAFEFPVIHVISLPGRPYLVTCSKDGTIHVWSSTNFSLKKTANFSSGGDVKGLVCLKGSRRIAIGQDKSISIMDIEDDEEAFASEGNNEDSPHATS